MASYPEPDILEGEIIWALGRTSVSKASGGDGIPAELFKILKDDASEVLHSICQQIWKTQQWPQDWKRSILIPIPKKSSTKEWSNRTVALISHSSKVTFKILQAKLQHYVNRELPDVQPGFRKKKRNQRSNRQHLLDHRESKGIPEKHLPVSLTTLRPLTVWFTAICGKLLKRWEYQTITCLLRNLYAGQESS